MTRPEILFPLFAGLDTLDGVGPKTAKAFEGLGVFKPKDLLMNLPQAVIDRRRVESVLDISPPTTATLEVEVLSHQPPRRKGGAWRVMVRDPRADWALTFFHARGDYLERLLPLGQHRLVSGKIELFDGFPQMVHPEHVLLPQDISQLPTFEPVYSLTAGITQKMVHKAVQSTLMRTPELGEWIDSGLMQREKWPSWLTALKAAHHPDDPSAVSISTPARQRLAYDELFAHQVTLALARQTTRRAAGIVSKGDGRLTDRVLDALGFRPTNAQLRAVSEIAGDMASPLRMNRLLQGDVGAGKTLVAFLALLIAVEAGGQGVLMAPTEILARQHYESLLPLAEVAGIKMVVLTGRDRGAERREKLADLASGQIDILLGTHAVFQKDVEFHSLSLAVVDEQHRFGVAQRMELGAKGRAADVLVMTATPIPRSLALASYGDMDVSILDEKPPGRKPIKTVMISDQRLDEVVARLARAIAEGRQAYWVCPLVEESDLVEMTSAEARFAHLSAALGEDRVGLVHGQMAPAAKDAAMARFVAGQTAILVATTVIEVGVNVPNASIMVIEQAENFGLAQLHQLRGRVGRGSTESTCLLLYESPLSGAGERRLKTIRDTEDGFRIAEEDLAMRGAGDLIGTAQSGLPKFRIADLERQSALMAVAQSDARKLLFDDPNLTSDRGKAVRALLWLLNHDRAIRLISVG